MIFDPETSKKLSMSKFIKGKEFENEGLTLQFVSVSKEESSEYGAEESNSLVERGVLEEGERFVFTFKDTEGNERTFGTTSPGFVYAMNSAEINEGDNIHITRTGQAKKTRYSVDKTEPF